MSAVPRTDAPDFVAAIATRVDAHPRAGGAHLPLQGGEVHRRAAAAPRGGAWRPAAAGAAGGAFSRYGLPLGEAFQLRDDVLGTFGDPEVTGKAVGEDLREGKPTLLYALARQRATGEAAELLARRFGASDLSVQEVAAMQSIFEDTGAREDVENKIGRLVDESLRAAAVDWLPVTDEARQALTGLAYFVAGRKY